MFTQPKPVLGIDISDLSAKLIVFGRERKKTTLSAMAEVGIAKGIIIDGRIQKQAELVKIIINLLQKAGLGWRERKKISVAASLPEQESFVQVIKMPALTKQELSSTISWEIEASIPLSIKDVYYDWQVIEPFKNDNEHSYVLVAAEPKQIIDSYLRVLRQAGLSVETLEVESQALVRALIKDGYAEHPIIILDIGATGTGLAIFSGQVLCLTAHLPFSGQIIDQALQQGLGLKQEQIFQWKKQVGLGGSGRPGQEIKHILKPLLDKMVAQMNRYIDFFHERGQVSYVPDGIIAKIVLTGGDSLLPGLVDYLTTIAKLPVELGNPLLNIKNPALSLLRQLKKNKAMTYCAAIGLALKNQAK